MCPHIKRGQCGLILEKLISTAEAHSRSWRAEGLIYPPWPEARIQVEPFLGTDSSFEPAVPGQKTLLRTHVTPPRSTADPSLSCVEHHSLPSSHTLSLEASRAHVASLNGQVRNQGMQAPTSCPSGWQFWEVLSALLLRSPGGIQGPSLFSHFMSHPHCYLAPEECKQERPLCFEHKPQSPLSWDLLVQRGIKQNHQVELDFSLM